MTVVFDICRSPREALPVRGPFLHAVLIDFAVDVVAVGGWLLRGITSLNTQPHLGRRKAGGIWPEADVRLCKISHSKGERPAAVVLDPPLPGIDCTGYLYARGSRQSMLL